MYQLGIPGDVDNSIFMINAYPWEDKLGVNFAVDDFSRRTGRGTNIGIAPGMIVGGAQMNQPSIPAPVKQPMHMGWGAIAIIAIIIAVIVYHMNS